MLVALGVCYLALDSEEKMLETEKKDHRFTDEKHMTDIRFKY